MHRKTLRWLAVSLFLGLSLRAKDVPGQYIVQLADIDPAAVPRKGARLAAVRTAQARVRQALEEKQVEVLTTVGTVMNAMVVKADDPAALEGTPGVAKVYPVRLYKKVMDRAAMLHKIQAAGDTAGGWENAGAGIKIAVIDSGIDASHPAFLDAGFKMPDGFPRVNKDTDNRYTNNKVIVARNYDTRVSAVATDRDGHGTGVAMIAAGVRNTGPRATIMGMAPKAYLGNYKVFPDDQDGAPNSYILKAIDDAVSDGMDVINLSLGGFPAERLESDPIAEAVENATRAGVIVVVASGNEGPGLNTIGSPATAPSSIAVGSSWSDRVFAASAWLDGVEPFVAMPGDGPSPSAAIRSEIADAAAHDPSGLACTEFPAGSLTGKVVLILRGTCFFEEKLKFAQQAGAVGAIVYTDAARPEPLSMDVGTASLPAVMISYRDGLRAKERLSQGSPTSVILDFETKPVLVNPARLAGFTSKGPGIQNLIKPDLITIGTAIYTAQPVVSGAARYSALQGTSFSAPMVSGAAALLKAYRPGLSADQYKSLLANSAAVFSVQDAILPVQEAGAGFLDVTAAVRSTLTSAPSSLNFGAGGSSLDATQRVILRNIGPVMDTFSISAAATSTGAAPEVTPNVVELPPGGTAEIAVRLSGSNLPAQAHDGFLVIRGTQTDVAARVPYWYAVTNGTVSSIDVLEAPESERRAATAEFLVRSLDNAGVPVNAEPKVKAIVGAGARVTAVESYDHRYPGFYRVRVRLSSEAGENVFEIDAGAATARVTINGV